MGICRSNIGRSLATEWTQEFPPLKKSVTYNSAFTHNILSLCDNGVTNSRLMMLPNSEIRQNESVGTGLSMNIDAESVSAK